MRAIIFGSELISLATAYHLFEMGYEVTVLETRTEASTKQASPEQSFRDIQLFKQELERKLNQSSVCFKYACILETLIVHHNRIRGITIRNEHNQSETMMADRFVATVGSKENPALRALELRSHNDVKPFNYKQYRRCPFIGRGRYSNLYLNIECSDTDLSTIVDSAQLLADFVFNPSLANSHSILQKAQARLSAFFLSTFSTFYHTFA